MKLTEYSDKSIAVYGDTKEYKDILKTLGGKWNANLRDGPGWIFSIKHKESVKSWIDGICKDMEEAPSVTIEPFIDIVLKNYSEKSFCIYGDTKKYKEKLKTMGGKWNANLRDGAGWIFANKCREEVERWLVDL